MATLISITRGCGKIQTNVVQIQMILSSASSPEMKIFFLIQPSFSANEICEFALWQILHSTKKAAMSNLMLELEPPLGSLALSSADDLNGSTNQLCTSGEILDGVLHFVGTLFLRQFHQ